MRYTDIDRQLEELAAKQHGVFSRQQAFTIGASERFVQRRLTRHHHGCGSHQLVYRCCSRAGETWRRQCKISELALATVARSPVPPAAARRMGSNRLRARG